jgi:hypothetical protein
MLCANIIGRVTFDELQNVIERAVIVSFGPTLKVPLADIQPHTTPLPAGEDRIARSTRRRAVRFILAEVDRDQSLRALKEADGRVGGPNGTATRLGLKRTTFITRMKKWASTRRRYTNASVSAPTLPTVPTGRLCRTHYLTKVLEYKPFLQRTYPLGLWHLPCLYPKCEKKGTMLMRGLSETWF